MGNLDGDISKLDGRHIECIKSSDSPKHKKKRFEFSKLLVVAVLGMGLYHQNWSYRLAEQGKDTNASVTVAITTVIISTCLGYLIKSALEKKSRNENHLDAYGVPYSLYQHGADVEKEGEVIDEQN